MQELIISREIYWLTLTVSMSAILWLPYIINRLYEEGIAKALWNPEPDAGPKAQWAVRMMAAHENAVENLVIFIPLVLIIQILGINNESTAFGCALYFFARLAHYLVFSFGIPILRVVIYFVGFYAQVLLAVAIFNKLF